MAEKHPKGRWAEKKAERAEKKRLKLEQTGDSPEKAAQHRKPGEKDPMEVHAPIVGGSGFDGGG
jgi:hypothetical protein